MLIIYKLTELESLVIKRYGNACYEAALDRLEQINRVREEPTTLYSPTSPPKEGYVMWVKKLPETSVHPVVSACGEVEFHRLALVRIGNYALGFSNIEVFTNYKD